MFSYSHIVSGSPANYAFSMSLNLHIREIRKAKGLTIGELAEMVGVSTPHMSGIERGVKNFNNHLIERISSALGVPPGTLISGDLPEEVVRLNAVLANLDRRDAARVAAFAEALLRSEAETQQAE